jgi:tRNA pseudouridine32 synthase/23S rRNA pseudouridine746 synthase
MIERMAPLSEGDRAFVRSLVIHEDEAVLAFNKPSGLPVQTRNPDDRTLDQLMQAFARSNGKRPRLVHRLDALTSGVIIAARTQPDAARLSASFADRKVAKSYIALAHGAADWSEYDCDQALIRYRPADGVELMRTARPGEEGGQAARTRFEILGAWGGYRLVRARPETGRMHQIRAHLSALGLPIVGDPWYGGLMAIRGAACTRLFLHAASLRLEHPRAGTLRLDAPPPRDFTGPLEAIDADLSARLAALLTPAICAQ